MSKAATHGRRHCARSLRALFALIALLITVVLAASTTHAGEFTQQGNKLVGNRALGNAFQGRSTQAPNILLIFTDDQTTESYSYMPFLKQKRSQAHVFRHYIHAMSMCCPSRASMFTGMYPHNTNVEGNKAPDGGYARFKSEKLITKSWPILLRHAGYRPSISGKFFNDYKYPMTEVMQGFIDWFVSYGFGPIYNYQMSDNGSISFFGTGDQNYRDFVEADRVDALIRRAHRRHQPFAILFAPNCPHWPSWGPKKYRGKFDSKPFIVRKKLNFNEEDVSDKPPAIRRLPRLTKAQISDLKTYWHRRLECGLSIDDALAQFWKTLKDLGELDNTYILLTTDNGWMQGEHRIPKSKNVPYVESFESRLFVWGPDIVSGGDLHLVGNIDLMPTILDMAGLNPSNYSWIDGRSLLPLAKGLSPQWRNTFLLQGKPEQDSEEGAVLTEEEATSLASAFQMHASVFTTISRTEFYAFVGERNNRTYIYTQYHGDQTGKFEFYDLDSDPYQLDNAYHSLNTKRKQAMQDRLDMLKTCAGQTCRIIDVLEAPR